MKHFGKCLMSAIICLSANVALAQQSVIATGGDATGSGGSVSYTVGQIDYQTNDGSGGSSSEGVQQPYEIFIVGITENLTLKRDIQVYPNPTNDFLFLELDEIGDQMQMIMYDENGKEVLVQKINTERTRIQMNNQSTGMYLLNITENNKLLESIKIIKNQ